jgi:hypothetical protein
MPILLALSLGTAKAIAVVAVVLFAIGTIVSAWLFKNVALKAAMAAVFALLTLLIWTQRSSLIDCQELVRTAVAENRSTRIDTTCSFLGQDVNISTVADE